MASRQEVAVAAGVSMRTVSNVVNGFVHVAPHTRARVLAVIAELDYRPSELARNLKNGRSGLVGLVLPQLDTPYFAELTRAVVEEGARRSLTVVIDQTDGDRDRELALIDRTDAGSLFDALIISPLSLSTADVDAIATDRALVFLGEKRFPRFDQVAVDNDSAVRDAVRHLIATGRTRIAAIGAERSGHESSSVRLTAFLAALEEAGLEPAGVEYVASFRRAEGAAAMRRLVGSGRSIDAVFCFSDPLALGALRVLGERGIRAPDDIALVGFDDIDDGEYSTPSLSTITPDRRFIATTALDLIEAKPLGLPPQLVTAPHRLTVRESS